MEPLTRPSPVGRDPLRPFPTVPGQLHPMGVTKPFPMVPSQRKVRPPPQAQFLPRARTMWPSPTDMGPLHPSPTDPDLLHLSPMVLDPLHPFPIVTGPIPTALDLLRPFPVVLGPLHPTDVMRQFPVVPCLRKVQSSLRVRSLPRVPTM